MLTRLFYLHFRSNITFFRFKKGKRKKQDEEIFPVFFFYILIKYNLSVYYTYVMTLLSFAISPCKGGLTLTTHRDDFDFEFNPILDITELLYDAKRPLASDE